MNNFEQVSNYLIEEFYFIQALNEKLEVDKETEHLVYSFCNDNCVTYDSKTGELLLEIPQETTDECINFKATITHASQLRPYRQHIASGT